MVFWVLCALLWSSVVLIVGAAMVQFCWPVVLSEVVAVLQVPVCCFQLVQVRVRVLQKLAISAFLCCTSNILVFGTLFFGFWSFVLDFFHVVRCGF